MSLAAFHPAASPAGPASRAANASHPNGRKDANGADATDFTSSLSDAYTWGGDAPPGLDPVSSGTGKGRTSPKPGGADGSSPSIMQPLGSMSGVLAGLPGMTGAPQPLPGLNGGAVATELAASVGQTGQTSVASRATAGATRPTGAIPAADDDADEHDDPADAGLVAPGGLSAGLGGSASAAQPLLDAAHQAGASLISARSDSSPSADAAAQQTLAQTPLLAASTAKAGATSLGAVASALKGGIASLRAKPGAAGASAGPLAVGGGPAAPAGAPGASSQTIAAVATHGGDDGALDADGGDPGSSANGGEDEGAGTGAAGTFTPQLAPAPAAASTTATAATPAASAATPLSATAADLAAQMSAKVSAGASRFQLQLNPEGLGRVDVEVSISAGRQLTARLGFADADVARALGAHAGELKAALEQAGFSVPAGGFDFAQAASASGMGMGMSGGGFAGGQGGQRSDQGFAASSSAGGRGVSAFAAGEALASAPSTASAYSGGGADSRLDIRI